MLNKIISTISKTTHQVYFLDTIMHHVKNLVLKEKWAFTFRTYNNLVDSINIYKSDNQSAVIVNYIINDYETLYKMIDEFKEDIYNKLNPQIFMLLDKFSVEDFISLKEYEKSVLEKYETFSKYIGKYLLYELEDLKMLAKKVINVIDENEELKTNKLIPYDKLHNILKLHILDTSTLIKIYNIFTSTMKIIEEECLKEDYQKLKFDTVIALIGDIDV